MFEWLEEVEGEKALAWVEEKNEASQAVLKQRPEFQPIYDEILEVLDSKDRIPDPSFVGEHVYNFWRDDVNVKGLWRRTTLEGYLQEEIPWEEVLDIDRLAEEEGENWVFKGYTVLRPECRRCMLQLSRGGADAVVCREFDLAERQFVESGFFLPEAKTSLAWRDQDSLYVGTDFGPASLTDSGYPRIRKLWKRGTSIQDAEVLFEGEQRDVGVWCYVLHRPEGRYDLLQRSMTFYTREVYLLRDGKPVLVPIPEDAELQEIFEGRLIFELKSDWEGYRQGALLAVDLERFLEGERNCEVLVEPSERRSIAGVACTRDSLLVNLLENVSNRLFRYRGKEREELSVGEVGSIYLSATSSERSEFFVAYTGFLTPSSLWLVNGEPRQVKRLPSYFDESPFEVEQLEATSEDGTQVPYFLIRRPDGGPGPTLLYGYGGFEVSLTPSYIATVGRAWLSRGGTYAIANIRGGGEFGPRWHRAALKENRERSFQDFLAVAEDLVTRGVTTPSQLGIQGGSNGGLLMGVAFTRRPDLFKAVVCQVPLLDMKRYHLLLAGASWMGEYGDPDKAEEWEYISRYSPFHNVKPGVAYPKVLFTTSTRDDRVHPGHARKMVALMESQGHPVLYYENTEGGHAGASDNPQRAFMSALGYAYLHMMLSSRHS